MGAMTCDRRNCGVPCSQYFSYKYGYLCEDCFNEMKKSGLSIEAFMATSKNEENKDYDGEFKKVTEE